MVKLKTKNRLNRIHRNGASQPLRLDLGAGSNTREGFIGVDNAPDSTAKIKHDLTVFPWPFDDDSVDEVFSSHFLEHIPGRKRIPFMDELWRVMKVGAKATFITPYWSSMRAIQDPTHEWPPLCEASFLYFNRGWREQNKLTHYLGKCNFDFTYGRSLDGETSTKNQETQNFWANRYLNAATDVIVNLEKKP